MPVGLPDEQLELMMAYLQLRADARSGSSDERVMVDARAAELRLQAEESAAWASSRKGVVGDG